MRKAQQGVELLGVIAIGIVVAVVTMGVGGKVLRDVQLTVGGNETVGYQTAQWLAVNNGSLSIANLSTNVPLIATIAALVIVVSFVLMLKGRSE